MTFFKLPEKSDTLLALFGLSFVIFGWFALSLALSSLFRFSLVTIGMALIFSIAIFIGWKFLSHAKNDVRFVFVIALFYAFLIGSFIEPTLFSGRDQGSIAEAAYRLAQNTELAFTTPGSESFFEIYGEGTALNFPGFAYTKEGYLLTQFPLGYTAWLASFVSVFGLQGYAIANAILLFLFLLTFYGLLRLFVHPFYAILGFVLAIFSFLPSWFSKLTLTENLSVFLFTFLLYNLFLFIREGKFIFYAGTLLTAALFAFTRIEGFAFLFLTLVVLAFNQHTRSIIRTYPWKSAVFPGLIFVYFFLRDFYLNLPYYKMIGKALIKFLNSFTGTEASIAAAQTTPLTLGSVFFLYGLLVIFLLGLFGILVFTKEKRPLLLLPAFITLPVFLYLFHPNITFDHPWMLRRYLFSLYPALLFSAVLCLALLFDKTRTLPIAKPEGKRLFFVSILFLSLLILQLPAWNTQATFAENRSFLKQIEAFSKEFSDRDLILVDRNASGDGFAMLSGPAQFLYGKNTVYFFNPHDLSALNTSHFEHVYLLVPTEGQSRYADIFGEKLIYKKSVVFSLEQFENLPLTSKDSFRLPEKTIIETHNLLFQIQ